VSQDRVRRHVWVSGRVQNVWFRDACRAEAHAHAVDGWVRNLADGRVEAVFEGSPEAVEALVAWCHEGPSRARVARVEVLDEHLSRRLPWLLGDQGFEVR
jgi:acylphosphatase